MDICLENLEKVNTGGGDIYILSDKESEEIINGATINNEVPRYVEVLGGKWGIAKKDSLVKLGMQKNPYTRNHWMGLFVVYYENRYQRVDLQVGKCTQCDWEGWTGTPLSMDIYTGKGQERVDLASEAEKLPVLSCPKCGGKLDKHAIWIEKQNGDQ